MTGIAGKSKGCTTCRRRKIKCDLALPACQNCSRFNRKCEGYERYPVFINRTTNGVAIRKPLEEAKLSSSGAKGVSAPADTLNAPLTQATITCLDLRSRKVESDRYIAWFWESFAPTVPLKSTAKTPKPHWLQDVLSVTCRCPALEEALLALSLTRYGKVHKDHAVLRKGQQVYTQALSLLQHSLYDEELAVLDETLATVSVMALHEILETTSKTPEGWSKHLNGFASLLKHRGPQRHRDVLPRKLFEQSRYMLMLHAIKQRKLSTFGAQAWQEEPWIGVEKDFEQRIFDHGLRLGGLLEKADLVFRCEVSLGHAKGLLRELEENLNSISILQGRSSMLATAPFAAFSQRHDDPTLLAPTEIPLTFPQIITALGIQLIACVTGYTVAFKAIEVELERTIPPSIGNDGLLFDVQAFKSLFDSWRMKIAQGIHRSTSSFLGDTLGIRGASRAILPLRLALEQFEISSTAYLECSTLLQKLEGKGMEYVPHLGRNEAVAARIIRRGSLLYG